MPDCTGRSPRETPHPLLLDDVNHCVTCGRGPFDLAELIGGDERAVVEITRDLKPGVITDAEFDLE